MSEEERKFLEIVDLKKGFGSGETRQEVLRGMNFSVAKGEFCVLLGPSGSGKSTLLNIIGGIDSADSGYISINGDKLKDMSEKKLTQYRRKHLGYVFQMYNLIANLNVKENIEVGAYLSDNALDIDELLHTLGLYEHRYQASKPAIRWTAAACVNRACNREKSGYTALRRAHRSA